MIKALQICVCRASLLRIIILKSAISRHGKVRVNSTLLIWLTKSLVFMAHEFHEYTRNMLNYINGDLIGRTNFH